MRRYVCIFAVFVLILGASNTRALDWWPMRGHDPAHTGCSTSTAPSTNNTIWNLTTGNWVTSSPAVVDGKVFVGSVDCKVYCLDALTGAHLWDYTAGDDVCSSPAVADDKVYVGSHDCRVYCLNASTGAQIWNYTTGLYIFSSPAVVDGRVFVGSYDCRVYCLDALTGAHLWDYMTGGEVYSSPAVVDGRVFVGSYDGKIYCIDALTGTSIWNFTTGNVVWSSPAVVDGRVFVGSADYKLYCLNASNGAEIWKYTTGGYVGSSPAVAGGKVFVGSDDHKVYCLDTLTGVHVWNYTTGGVVYSSPAVVDGKVIVGSLDCRIYCLDALTGAHLWDYMTGGEVYSSPAVADGMVFVGSADANVYAFGARVLVVPDQYSTIQEAINNAALWDTIFVKAGTYYEHVVVNKSVFLVGEDRDTTIIHGNKTGPVVLVAENGANLTKFTIRAGQNTHPICDVWLENVSQCNINENTLADSFYGVYLNESDGNRICANYVTNLSIGICGFESDGNLLLGNEFGANSFAGINFHLCSFNNLTHNLIKDNSVGIRLLDGANNNDIYHNNFVDNTIQTYIQSSYDNTWDYGYPSGGNYWSNYDGSDARSGSYQNETGSDGIGDTPLILAKNNSDRYPLMKPWTEEPSLVGDVNSDGKVDMKDVGYVSRRFMCIPGDLLWDLNADFNGDGKINMVDIGTVARHFGEQLS